MLWTLVMVSLLVTAITATGGSRLRQAAALRRNAQLDAAAAGGVQEAVFHLLDAGRDHWPADGGLHRLEAAGTRLTLRIDSETGKVNPNRATPQLLAGLLQAVGIDARQAVAVATAIVDWRFPGTQQTFNSGSGPLLPGAPPPLAPVVPGRDYRPPGAPFESIAELGLVEGVTPALLRALAPYLTLYHNGDPDLPSASRVVLQAVELAAGPGAAPAADPAGPIIDPATGQPQRRDESLVAVTAIAQDGAGHRAMRRAIVLTGTGETADHRPFRVMQWDEPAG